MLAGQGNLSLALLCCLLLFCLLVQLLVKLLLHNVLQQPASQQASHTRQASVSQARQPDSPPALSIDPARPCLAMHNPKPKPQGTAQGILFHPNPIQRS